MRDFNAALNRRDSSFASRLIAEAALTQQAQPFTVKNSQAIIALESD